MADGAKSQLVTPDWFSWQRLEKEIAIRNLVSSGSYLRRRGHRRQLGGVISHNGALPECGDGGWQRVGLYLSSRSGSARYKLCAADAASRSLGKEASCFRQSPI